MHVCYYVSGHGFGHACRTIPILERWKSRIQEGTLKGKVTLCTPHELSLFPDNLFDQCILVHRPISSSWDGVVQSDGVTVDVVKTAGRLRSWFGAEREEREQELAMWLSKESEWLQLQGATLLAGDAPFIIGPLARLRGIPAVLVTNFLWDSIYEGLMGSVEDNELQEWKNWLHIVSDSYRSCSVWLRSAGWLESSSFQDAVHYSQEEFRSQVKQSKLLSGHRCVVDVSPTLRLPITRDRRQVLEHAFACHPDWHELVSLNSLLESKLLLVTFGGHPSASQSKVQLQLPSGWKALLVNVSWVARGENALSVNGQEPSLYFPDLTLASEAVLGKLGYGTCGDCIASDQKPMIYVRRAGFVEEEGLLQLMTDYNAGRAMEMQVADLMSGDWRATLNELDLQFPPVARTPQNKPPQGDVEVTDLIEHIAESAGLLHSAQTFPSPPKHT